MGYSLSSTFRIHSTVSVTAVGVSFLNRIVSSDSFRISLVIGEKSRRTSARPLTSTFPFSSGSSNLIAA
ncbi:hypothetical protein NY2A_b252L [Paramecium bursaria Chlorella virus NY2A]|uniref:Uncharacterized protein b252L n=1 Tax=Paramecium bursaria Chlorella virus NY2A TaxID=46021 RepID=A7IWC7_PBCVN|nr:hypothetical protein NY2A_b252L [Paramecium bursaria Chlorella virus NY2A]YP_001498315.1 hypothetical protein AR158_C233L [Paramecium bursaria Chlorella virus AR158]ABT14651.1 hypothetical protein NY2A_b252L [Paramecium bursaria Chlorella virus NY2A]ABU43779.1 hypothetical protein AR158_C233L [Paramecium bursaria Chlorella virus AR158]